jgi:uncharacterized protein (TIRG00374 family)
MSKARYLIFITSLGLLGWFVYSRKDDLAQLPMYLGRVKADSIAVLSALELLFLVLAAQSNRLVYRSLGVSHPLSDQLQLLLAAGTVERFLPSGGAAGMSSYVWLARGCGIPVADSFKMTATTFVLGYAQIVPLLLVPFLFVDTFGFPRKQSLLISGISAGFVVLVMGIAAMIGSQRFVTWLKNLSWTGRFPGFRKVLEAAHQHVIFSWSCRRELLSPLLCLWMLYPVRIAMLWVCFAAFGSPASLGLLWTGYSVALLISFLTFLPTTLGVFELTMVGTFSTLGVSTELATAVTLLYRAFTYWAPIPLGLFAWWNLQRRINRER